MMEIEHEIRRYVHKPVFFSFIRYGTPLSTGQNTALKEKVILLTGIAQPLPLKNHLQHNYNVVEHIAFPDHHAFARKDIIHLQQRVAHHHDAVVMTTEKDWIRLQSPELKELVEQVPLFYLPIEVDFIKNGKDFDEMVLNEIKRAG
jgi:tetraacyldisaccharide 4'-kinase